MLAFPPHRTAYISAVEKTRPVTKKLAKRGAAAAPD
jgi:hypothetical protein